MCFHFVYLLSPLILFYIKSNIEIAPEINGSPDNFIEKYSWRLAAYCNTLMITISKK